MVIQLPKKIEDDLNALAERTGTPAEQLAVDAIGEMLARMPAVDEQPRRPIDAIIGMLSDGDVQATEFEEWLAIRRGADVRLARKVSPAKRSSSTARRCLRSSTSGTSDTYTPPPSPAARP